MNHDPAGQGHVGLPRATIYLRPSGPGGSASALFGFSDGVKRATKLMGNPQGNMILANELVVAQLARLIEAPCPRGELVIVDQTMIEQAKREIPALANAVAGPAFGSAWVEPQYAPGEHICATARNRNAISGLIALYTWVNNNNLADAHLLWTSFPGNSHEVYGFDHGHCFGNPQWDGGILAAIPQIQMRTLPQLTAAASHQTVGEFLQRIGGLGKNQLNQAVSGIPQEWNVSTVPEFTTGKAEVREGGQRASFLSAVTDGRMNLDARARLLRGGQTVVDARVSILRVGGADVLEATTGAECHIGLDGVTAATAGDMVHVPSTDRTIAWATYLDRSREKVIQVLRAAFPP